MSIKITGIDMPKKGETLILEIASNGTVKAQSIKKPGGIRASALVDPKPAAPANGGVQRDENGAILTEFL
jgi:hypothetical protein